MAVAFRILKRDLMALAKNPIALLVVGALLVLPGLYAWYCIIANWDPYANTGSMPIAIVNEDKGATSELTGDIDIGKQVTEKLEENDSIDWRFYDSQDAALDDARTGVVYATLVLPENLSENIVGILSSSAEKPTLYYYPNEKYNAVATKVTDSAAQTLVRQVNQGFSSTVNETILASAQKVSQKVEAKAGEANASAIDEIHGIQADLEAVIVSLDDALNSIEGWRNAAHGADSALAATSSQLPQVRSLLQQGAGQLDSLRTQTGDFESGLSSTILRSAAAVSDLSAEASATLKQSTADLEAVEARLKALSRSASDDPELQIAVDALAAVTDLVEGIVSDVSADVSRLDGKVQDAAGAASRATSQISGEVMPQLNAGAYGLSTSFSELGGAIAQFEPQIANLRDVLAQTDGALATAVDAVVDAKNLLATIGANLKGTVADIGSIGNALQIQQLSDLLEVDPENVGTFVSSPVQMVTEKIYPVPNYGTAVAPFYTNLALWIGCFILVSLIKLEVDRTDFEEATPTQRYFGRWLLLMILAILQSQVICGVDILLGISCVDPGYFMMAGFVCSIAYMNIIFALVITFRNIGKTLCILLLIMQVPGSSGMYPIEMMPQFFQIIHPLLPFTYGIDAMREALSGMYGDRFLFDLTFLLLTIPVSLLLGLVIRPALSNLMLLFDREMSATGFFASEVHAQASTDRMRELLRLVGSNSEARDALEERAWRFNRRYPRLRRIGTATIMIIPFLYLFIVLPFNLNGEVSINVKLGTLLLMIVVLLLVQAALIVLEYMHRAVSEQTRMMSLEILNDAGMLDDPEESIELLSLMLGDDEGDGAGDGAGGSATGGNATGNATSKSGKPKLETLSARFKNPAWDIFSTDMRLGFKSVIGVVVVVLLVITPSMYAWFNIAGSWDPYGSTGNLKVAVANEDAGYKGELIPVTITIGDTVVSQLRGNNSFDWIFVDSDEAVRGVQSGEYYAAIEIPSEFSQSMMTYLIDDAEYPDVIYYTNEKENPIAPIITQKGADSIQENIRVSFTERVDEVALSVAYDLLNYLENPRMTDYVVKMSAHLDDATADAGSAAKELRTLSGLSGIVAGIVQTTGTTLDGVQAAGEAAKGAVSDAKAGASNATAAFDRAAAIIEEMVGDRELDISGIVAIVDAALDMVEGGSETVPDVIQGAIAAAEAVAEEHADEPDVVAASEALVEALEAARDNAAAVPGKVSDARGEIDGLASDATAEVRAARAFFADTVKPSISGLRETMKEVASSTSQIVGGLEGAVDGLGDSTGGLSNQLDALSGGLSEASDTLDAAANSLKATKERVAEALRSGDLRQIEEVILGSDPEVMAASLAAPLQQQREPVYSVANYGSAMAPFYTVLSLWVGALVMISTMRTRMLEERVEELRRRYEKVALRHEFFGRYGIFGFIGILQSTLVLLGDLLFLDIQCANPVMFFACGLFVGQVFCLVVYTLTELFGDVGKALCVILLIMQVAASGGTFPAEMLDPLLHDIVPFLPFYHAMRLLQECVAGIYWPTTMVDVLALLSLVGSALAIALVLHKPFRKVNIFFEEQLEKTGYM